MKDIGCPAHIKFLLHCHVSPEPFDCINAPVYTDLIPQLIETGAIEKCHEYESSPCSPPRYRTTAMGKAWVQALCNVPPPKAVFVDEKGRVLL